MEETPICASVEHDLRLSVDELIASPETAPAVVYQTARPPAEPVDTPA